MYRLLFLDYTQFSLTGFLFPSFTTGRYKSNNNEVNVYTAACAVPLKNCFSFYVLYYIESIEVCSSFNSSVPIIFPQNVWRFPHTPCLKKMKRPHPFESPLAPSPLFFCLFHHHGGIYGRRKRFERR